MINLANLKNPIALAVGILVLFSLSACQSVKTPEETTLAFWSAIAANDLALAKEFCSSQSLQSLSSSNHQSLLNSKFSYGKILVDGNQASVETKVSLADNKKMSFSTFLLKEGELWKVDYQRSAKELAGNPVSELFKSLNTLGQTFKKKLENQIPLIEKEVESYGNKLKEQLDSIENQLNKPSSKPEQENYPDTI